MASGATRADISRKKLAELKEHADGSVAALKAAEQANIREANRPEDLFKGLDAMLEKAAKAEAEAAVDSAADLFSDKEPEIGGLNPLARPGEEVPSPDSLFRGLADKRKSKG